MKIVFFFRFASFFFFLSLKHINSNLFKNYPQGFIIFSGDKKVNKLTKDAFLYSLLVHIVIIEIPIVFIV